MVNPPIMQKSSQGYQDFDNEMVREINKRIDRVIFGRTFEFPDDVLIKNKENDSLYIALECVKRSYEPYPYYTHYHVCLESV